MDEDDRLALARLAVADPAGGKVDLGAVGRWLRRSLHPPRSAGSSLAPGKLHTDSMNVKEQTRATASPTEGRRSQAERSETTRAALVEAARPLFAERGYAAVGTEEIVRAAGVTRGALYHHFDGKRELFEAVYEQIEVELAERIATGALSAGAAAPLEAMRAGAEMFLRGCTVPRSSGSRCSTGPRCSAGTAGARSAPSTASA